MLEISFTEPPTGDTRLRVRDGCGDNVVESIDLNGTELAAQLEEAQPGRWEVSTAVVSGIDGHPTRDTWGFRVRGRAQCSEPGDNETGAPEPEPDVAVNTDDEGSGFPVVPFALGSVAVIGLAVLVRKLTAA